MFSFCSDARMKGILEKAAQTGNAIMRVQSFADRRADKIVWKDCKREWAVLRSANGTFDTENFTDLYAREKWFYQAQIESPAMFNRASGAGSLYWLGVRDSKGAYLDGSKIYKLTVPLPRTRKTLLVCDHLRQPNTQRNCNRTKQSSTSFHV